MSEKRVLKHDIFERITHWVLAFSVIILIVSGLSIRYPGSFGFKTMNGARYIHFIFMYALIFSTLFHIYHSFVAEFKNDIFKPSDIKGLGPVIKYYLFLSDTLPPHEKYNALQKLTYNLLWILIILQALTGIVLYVPLKFEGLTLLFGGLMSARVLHDFLTYIFIAFIISHLYLVLSEGVSSVWTMITGYNSG